MNARKIAVVTGSRADYGLLFWLLRGLQDDTECELQLLVTGMHLCPEFGLTVNQIEADGFVIAARVESQLSSDTAVGVSKSLGLGLLGFADALQRLQPELIVLLGDRYEMFAAGQAAYFAQIPIAHIAGGDVTEGAFDEAIRHSLTKMASLHFVTNTDSARRVRQLGEAPERIFNVGSPGIDGLLKLDRLDKEALSTSLGIPLHRRLFLVTFHAATLDAESSADQAQALLQGLRPWLDGQTTIIFTKPNADTGGRAIIRQLEHFATEHADAHLFDSLGQLRYLSLMALCDIIIGNSSSGLYEAPSLQRPVVNIGNRQKGRLAADCVVHCEATAAAIENAIASALALDCSATRNPYGDGQASVRILAQLKAQVLNSSLIQKHFHEL